MSAQGIRSCIIKAADPHRAGGNMKRIVPGLLLMVVATLQPGQAAAQDPNDPLLNMQAIAQALGVQCAYCHVRQADNSTDFQADTNPKKAIARLMIAMTREINARVQLASGKVAGQATNVHCLTCHRGTPIPQKLTDIVLRTLRDKGADAAVAEYRELRQKFYARDTYDFSETELLNLAQRLADARPDDAIALMTMNLEFNPKSVRSYIVLSRAYGRKRDNDMAIASLKKALEIEPENGIVKGYLSQLEPNPYRR